MYFSCCWYFPNLVLLRKIDFLFLFWFCFQFNLGQSDPCPVVYAPTNDIFIEVVAAGSEMPKTPKPIYPEYIWNWNESKHWWKQLKYSNNTIKQQATGDKGIELNEFSNNEQSNIGIYRFDFACVLSKATEKQRFERLPFMHAVRLIRYDVPRSMGYYMNGNWSMRKLHNMLKTENSRALSSSQIVNTITINKKYNIFAIDTEYLLMGTSYRWIDRTSRMSVAFIAFDKINSK